MATDLQQRFAMLLTDTATIKRQSAETGADDDLVLGAQATVATGVPCLFQALRASADMLAAGPVERDVQQLFLAHDADILRHDVVEDAAGVEWIVDGVPQVFQARGEPHHTEALVSRKAVQ